MIIGLTGVPQSGKTELEPAIERAGWRFFNLNLIGNSLREQSAPTRAQFEALIRGVWFLGESGVRLVSYYLAVHRDPTILERFTALEIDAIRSGALAECERALATGENVLLSWEQLDLLPELPFDHLLVLKCERSIWLRRIQARALKRGATEPMPDDDWAAVLKTVGFDPEEHLERMRRLVPPDRLTVVDTSADDWGEALLSEELTRLARL